MFPVLFYVPSETKKTISRCKVISFVQSPMITLLPFFLAVHRPFCIQPLLILVCSSYHRKKLEIPKWNIIGNLNPNVGPLLDWLRTDIPILENNWYRNVMIPVIYQDHTNVKSLRVPTLGYIWHFTGSAKLWYTNVGELLVWEWNDSSEISRTYQCKILKCTSLGIYLAFYWKC